jgi:tetratricopeptide (TPR) repeat protein
VKVILAGCYASPQDRARFNGEVEAIGRLSHPNIVRIFEGGEHEGRLFYSMEFIDGGTLEDRLRRRLLEPREAAQLVEMLARAVQYAHGQKVLHRDLKPSNVLLDAAEQPHISDFGLAKKLDADDTQTSPGLILGTPCYMAPEQAKGNGQPLGWWTDVYALGGVLYACLTGRPPFRAATSQETVRQVLEDEPVAPRRLNPAVPRDLETICLKCLQKEAKNRYATAAELADDLHRFLEGEPIRAVPARSWERAWKWAKRRPLQAALAASLVVALLASLGGAVSWALYQDAQSKLVRKWAETRAHIYGLWDQGRERESGGKWLEAKGSYDAALEACKAAPDAVSEDVHRQIAEAQGRVEGRMKEQAVREASLGTFRKLHEALLFREVDFRPDDAAANAEFIRQNAPTAFAALGFGGAELGAVVAGLQEYEPYVKPPQQFSGLTAACYQLLLAWAEAEAPPPGARDGAAAQKAMELLDVAERLGQKYRVGAPRAFRFRRARYLDVLGRGPEADAQRQLAGRVEPETALDLFFRAWEDYREGKRAQAAQDCQRVLQLEHGHFWAWYLKALCHYQSDDWVAAEACFTACLDGRPDFFWSRLLRGMAYSKLRQYREAEDDFRIVWQQAADDPVARWEVLLQRGYVGVKRREWDAAAAALREAIALRPQAVEAYATLAEAFKGRKDYGAARDTLTDALAQRPGDPGLYHGRAQVHVLLRDWPRARRDFEKAIECDPRAANAQRLASDLTQLAQLQHLDKDYAGALESCDRALGVQCDYAPAFRQQGITLLALGRHAEAGQALDGYLRVGRADPAILEARGLIHFEQGKYSQAIGAYDRSLQLRPEDVRTLSFRGWAYLKLKDYAAARDDFEAALRLDRTSADALCGRAYARARQRQGEAQAAVKDAEAALEHARGVTPELRYRVACVYALVAGWEKNASTAAFYADRAEAHLEALLKDMKSQERKVFWAREDLNEGDLAPLTKWKGIWGLKRNYGQ